MTDSSHNYQLVLGYDGSGFAGSQRQGDRRTVQLELERAWQAATGECVTATLAGRTDAGVHAEGQVASVRSSRVLAPWDLKAELASSLPGDVALKSVSVAEPDFDARRSARWRRYEYVLPLHAERGFGSSYLDEDCMRLALTQLLGERDFTALASSSELGPRGARRRLLHASVGAWSGSATVFAVVADAFLRQMVRRIVSAVVAVGSGRLGMLELRRAVEMRSRHLLPGPAPARYLTLAAVGYGEYR
ncbi:MAG: tRNA pseudouridine(38-40) synthase TruA [Chloroflexota bacterium]|nr:tRNA pseudouridine(38-40) synthase TruA [Chloroflexota bacterium]